MFPVSNSVRKKHRKASVNMGKRRVLRGTWTYYNIGVLTIGIFWDKVEIRTISELEGKNDSIYKKILFSFSGHGPHFR